MTASNSRLQNLLCLLLVLIWTLTWSHTVSGASPMMSCEGEVGKNVTFHCPVDQNREIVFVYFQMGEDFVNGYHSSRPILNAWPNTRVDRNTSEILIYNLNISHGGDYKCIINYKNAKEVMTIYQRLTVTAPYSKPVVTHECGEENGVLGCLATCVSHDGYPSEAMRWNVAQTTNVKGQAWILRNSSMKRNSSSSFFSSYSTAYFNCSSGEQRFNCSVGNVVSDNISVCVIDKPPSNEMVKIICSVLVVAVIVTSAVLCIKCKKRRPSFLEGVTSDNMRRTTEEIIGLNEKNEVNS